MNNKEEYKNAINEIKASEELKRKTMQKMNEKKSFKISYKLATAMSMAVVALGAVFIINNTSLEEIRVPQPIIVENKQKINLPTVDTIENMKKILKVNSKENEFADDTVMDALVGYTGTYNSSSSGSEMLQASSIRPLSASGKDQVSSEYSKTNTQVEGVDEADIVKTDGKYIYYITTEKIVIAQAGNDMKIVSEIAYVMDKNEYSTPREMYLSNNRLTVVVNENKYYGERYIAYDLAYPSENKTKIITYDIRDRNNPKEVKNFEIEGNYLDSRMVNGIVYLVTNKYVSFWYGKEELKEEDIVQTYTDSVNGVCKQIPLTDICYIPDNEDRSFLNIIAFETKDNTETKVKTILGAGNTIYANNENMYITFTKDLRVGDFINRFIFEPKTVIYKFAFDKMEVDCVASGEVPGNILNQFSMDEFNGNFRIAVTEYNEETSTNSLYVLDNELKVIGKLQNLAEGERIYSVRFMGEKAYIVTFVQTDPLFVIDLKNPYAPQVLGELKIPGYSKYLHPYDSNHLIGIGEDTEVKDTYWGQSVVRTGMKMALFDVTNPTNPVEMFSTKIGEAGTYSEILYNHKALLFSKEKNILAFPITITKNYDATSRTNLKFQGAIVYGISLTEGFTERGRIAHKEIQNSFKDYDYNQEILRIIYINNDLYTLSRATIKRTDMQTMQELDKVEIELPNNDNLVVVN